jgi:hypothetical protein
MSTGSPGLLGWPWPWPGGDGEDPPAPPEPVTSYLHLADGTLSQITVTGTDPVIPEGAKLVTQEEYEQLRGAMLEAREARIAELMAAEEESMRTQYADLKAAGIPEATARALSRYEGPAEGA